MPDTDLSSALAPYGRVIGVQHLTVRSYNNIRTGTRMVSMALEKPIPSELTIASFSCSVKYQGQPKYCFACQSFGHFGRQCPKSAAKRDRLTTNNKNNDPAPACPGSGLPNTATGATTTLPTAAADEPSGQNVHVTSCPIDVGASTSRDYVDTSSAPPPSQTAMDIVEPAAMEDSSSPVLDTTVVAGTVTISLTEFKSSSPAGDYSYTRHVSVKRLTKKERCAERVIARGVARSRRLARLAEARAANRTAAPSADSGVLFSPPASPVVTENRFVVLQDEVEETVEVTQVSPARIPLARVSPARVSPARVPPARVSPPRADEDDLAAIGASVVDPLAALQSTSLSPAPSSIQGSVALSALGTLVADIPPSSASEGQASGALSPVASEQAGPISDSQRALVPIGFDFDSDLRLSHADGLQLGTQPLPHPPFLVSQGRFRFHWGRSARTDHSQPRRSTSRLARRRRHHRTRGPFILARWSLLFKTAPATITFRMQRLLHCLLFPILRLWGMVLVIRLVSQPGPPPNWFNYVQAD